MAEEKKGPLEEQLDDSVWKFPHEQREAHPGVFESGRESSLRGDAPDIDPARDGVMGDSRPDETDPEGAEFVDVSDHPMVTTDRETSPEVHKVDPQFLAEHRVDQEDEIVGRPSGAEGENEEAVLRPRVSKKGAESSQL